MKTQFTANAIFFIFYPATILRSVSSILNRFMYINGFRNAGKFPNNRRRYCNCRESRQKARLYVNVKTTSRNNSPQFFLFHFGINLPEQRNCAGIIISYSYPALLSSFTRVQHSEKERRVHLRAAAQLEIFNGCTCAKFASLIRLVHHRASPKRRLSISHRERSTPRIDR